MNASPTSSGTENGRISSSPPRNGALRAHPSAFLVPEATLAQRVVRATRTLTAARVPVELPAREDVTARLASVLEVLHLIVDEGSTATAGADLTRPDLCQEAMRPGRILGGLVPEESEVHGLVALMELQASRLASRTAGDCGVP